MVISYYKCPLDFSFYLMYNTRTMKPQPTTCTKCLDVFHFYPGKPGLKNECWGCGRTSEEEREVIRHVAVIDGEKKLPVVTVLRNADEKTRRVVRNHNSGRWWRNT
jgi:hypothetical protein